MNVVDSSAWLEYFADGPNAKHFARVIEAPDELLVPTITLLEVFKRVCQQRDESIALQCIGVMQQSAVIELDAALALLAASLGLRYKLPLADSIVYATAQRAGAIVWTQDADFKGLQGVKFWPKPTP
jgi:predicted nucleic acid-binding protein